MLAALLIHAATACTLVAATSTAVDKQCTLPYKNVSDAWRNVTNDCSGFDGPSKDCEKGAGGPGGNNMGDTFLGDVNCVGNRQATGVGDGGWYRFVGVGGDALPLRPPGGAHCGTEFAGWLSGWNATPGCAYPNCTPPRGYSMPGRYPAATEGVAEMTACFDTSSVGQQEQCGWHVLVGVVLCDGFLLWRLPYSGGCGLAYCSTSATYSPTCNDDCIPEGVKRKEGQGICCTEGHKTHKCPKPAHYRCGPYH
jgi:hypothetical protein